MNTLRNLYYIAAAFLCYGLTGCNSPKPAIHPPSPNNNAQLTELINQMKMSGELSEIQAEKLLVHTDPMKRSTTAQPPIKIQPKELRGRLRSIGSSSMSPLMNTWERGFTEKHKHVTIDHEGSGSATMLNAMMEQRIDIAPMSRPLLPAEKIRFRNKFNSYPKQIPVALDCLTVYVHPSNPLAKKGFTFTTLDSIFSTSLNRGRKHTVTHWGQLGLTGEWANKPITIFGRNNTSGSYMDFRKRVLQNGVFRSSIHSLESDEDVIRKISSNKYSIGYASIGFKTKGVATLPLAKNNPRKAVYPTHNSTKNGTYPLIRHLFLTVNGSNSRQKELEKEFIQYTLSKEGQGSALKSGFYPVNAHRCSKNCQN